MFNGVVMAGSNLCTSDAECASNETCDMNQGDFNGNGIGDLCECYSDSNCDTKIGLTDITQIKSEFLRSDCSLQKPCHADYNEDSKVNLPDLAILKVQFNRTDCPDCPCHLTIWPYSANILSGNSRQFEAQEYNCSAQSHYVWSDTCMYGDVDQNGLFTAGVTTVEEKCTVSVIDENNTNACNPRYGDCFADVTIKVAP